MGSAHDLESPYTRFATLRGTSLHAPARCSASIPTQPRSSTSCNVGGAEGDSNRGGMRQVDAMDVSDLLTVVLVLVGVLALLGVAVIGFVMWRYRIPPRGLIAMIGGSGLPGEPSRRVA